MCKNNCFKLNITELCRSLEIIEKNFNIFLKICVKTFESIFSNRYRNSLIVRNSNKFTPRSFYFYFCKLVFGIRHNT